MSNPVVLITGALTGIGRATAIAFAKQGARLAVAGRREDAGQQLTTELRALGAEAEFFRADVRHEEIPGPDHPITIVRNLKRVVVAIGGTVLADSRDALILREAGYPAVQYLPRKDVDMTLLERTAHATYCPYKGDCAYFSIPSGGERAINAVWTYEAPYDALAAIRKCL